MRELLFLAHRVPFPPDRGDKMRSWQLLKAAAEHAPVHLVSFADDDRDIEQVRSPELRAVASSIHVQRRRRPLPLAAAAALARGCPISVEAFASRRVEQAVARLIERRPIDTIFAFSGQMARFALPHARDRRFVMDFVDVDSAKFQAYAAESRWPVRWLWRREAHRLFRWERMVAAAADRCVFVSEAEAALFRRLSGIRGDRVAVLENGMDLGRYDPALVPPLEPQTRGAAPLIVFTGQMDYRPNVQAVTGYARDVLPLVRRVHPQARFAIVGRNPGAGVRALASLPGVIVTGAVDDVRQWIVAADLVAAPLGIARGVQNKVLEAMALARPVVASPAAFEGIDARPGHEIVIADDAVTQAEAAIAILDEPALGRELGEAARRRMVERYRWEDRLAGFRALLAGEGARVPA